MELVATPFRKRDGADLPRVTPVKRANISAVKPASSQNLDKGDVARSLLQGCSLVAIGALTTAQIAEVLKTAMRMRELVEAQGGDESLKGKVLASVFYEPSTRTNCSFQAAMLRLGGTVVAVNESSSSVAKGETLEDTVRSMECYCDVVVLRHPRAGAAAEAAAAMTKPLLNAGDGVGEHPSQALLDLYTSLGELLGDAAAEAATSEAVLASALRGRVVTMVGDLKNGRTVHSLAKLLSRFEVTLNFVSPATLRMPGSVMAAFRGEEHDLLTAGILGDTDILYVTRVQKERFDSVEDYDKVKDAFVITPDTLSKMKVTARVLHPLPRVGEIDTACDADPRAAYFRQMKNGMYVRMALLRLTMG
jgi:carbamoyl-phosphate synthase/aspartate carbamoyltransferase/dihydroorotase